MDITLIQSELYWEDREANLEMLDKSLSSLEDTDLVVLPEMFNTAFSNRSESLSESMDGPTVTWMKEHALKGNFTLTGSLMIKDNDAYFNRLLWVSPDGKVEYYNKRHLFRMAGEHDHFNAGKERVIVELNGWRVMLQVCYDLRFPVFSRNRYRDGRFEYDLILYVANWPKPRHLAWSTLLRARAIENLVYCIGVNRIGTDANGLAYQGGSAIIDYLGTPLKEADHEPCILRSTISKEKLFDFRAKFPTGLDSDRFDLKV